MPQYLVAFRDNGQDHFITDCGFNDYFDAVCYAAQVLQVVNTNTVEARIWDASTRTVALHLTRGDASASKAA
jgi:hypothetical protein